MPHAVLLGLLLMAAELMCFLTARIGEGPFHFLHIADGLDDPQRMDEYLERRHPTLGWIPTPSEAVHVDRTGARESPAFPEPGNACVSVYGDSFAWGSDANEENAWANVLAKQMSCRVANYGVPGYGTDQALLRFEQQTEDEAPQVVLTIFPDNLLRCRTHYIGLVVLPELGYRGQKPAFELDESGTLKLTPMPVQTKEQMAAFAKDPMSSISGEFFHPEGYYARNRFITFPYLHSMVQFVSSEYFGALLTAKLSGKPVLEDYLRPGHPSGSFELTVAIARRFADGVKARGKKLVVVILPDRQIMAQFQEKGVWSHQPLIDRVSEFAPVINMGERFAERLQKRNFRELEHPDGHYTTEGYAMVAERVREHLKQ